MSTTDQQQSVQNVCWVITEGTIGMENQALGLAERLSLPIVIKRVRLKKPWRWLAPWSLGSPFGCLAVGADPISPPWPRLAIGCGRQSIPFMRAIRQASGHRTITVQTQNPRVGPENFDLVIPPEHDRLTGPNVLPILGSPNRISKTRLDAARAQFSTLFEPLKSPRVAVLVGGASNAYRFGAEDARGLAEALRALAKDHGLIVMVSRRTGAANTEILKQFLANTDAFVWNGEGENPYLGALAWADAFVVTADSTNMISEAAATGRPIHIAALSGGSAKFRAFHAALMQNGIARPFSGKLEDWTYKPLDETGRAAAKIQALLDVRRLATDISR